MGLLESEYDLDDPEIVSAIDDTPLWSAPFGLALLETVRMRRGIRGLDVGCGLGFPLIELAQRLGPTCTVYGVDPWEGARRRALAKARAWRLDNVVLVPARAEQLPFADASFGLVVSNNGTNNVDDEPSAFREISRVAGPGAQVVLTMNLPDTMIEFYRVYRGVLERMGLEDEIGKLEGHIHHKRKPLPHVLSQAEAVGLQVAHVHHGAFSLRYCDGSTMLASPFVRLAFLRPWRGLLAPGAVEPVFAQIEDELDRLAEASGELRLSVPWVCLDLRKPVRSG